MPNSTPLESGEPGTDVSRQSLTLLIHKILSLAQLADGVSVGGYPFPFPWDFAAASASGRLHRHYWFWLQLEKQSVFEGRVSLEWSSVGKSSSWNFGYSTWWSLHHSHVGEIGRLPAFVGIAF